MIKSQQSTRGKVEKKQTSGTIWRYSDAARARVSVGGGVVICQLVAHSAISVRRPLTSDTNNYAIFTRILSGFYYVS